MNWRLEDRSGSSRGLLLTGEGAGKSTALKGVCGHLAAHGIDVVVTREPGGTELAEAIRSLVLHKPMDALTEALLVFAARRDHVKQVIEPALKRGALVVCDRFSDSSFAYQGAARGGDLGHLMALESMVLERLTPDLTLLFDISPEEAARRRSVVRAADRFEQQDLDFFHRVRQGYAARREAQPERFVVVNAEKPPAEVLADSVEAVMAFLSRRRG